MTHGVNITSINLLVKDSPLTRPEVVMRVLDATYKTLKKIAARRRGNCEPLMRLRGEEAVMQPAGCVRRRSSISE